MTFVRISLLSLLAACASCAAPAPKNEPTPVEETAPPAASEPVPDEAAIAQANREAELVLARRFAEAARRHLDASELLQARQYMSRACQLDPKNEEYRQQLNWIEVNLGDRRASVTMTARQEVDRIEARREEELVTVRRFLAAAEKAQAERRWDDARQAYERALFVVRTSRFRDDAAFAGAPERIERDLEALQRRKVEEERRLQAEATAAALAEIERRDRDQ
ncbi:MAG: hypothetical protein AAGD14_07590 [Planctomycetota bacterium]